jgi:hypothetical protein
LGRFPEQDLERIWRGEGYRRLRRGVVAEPFFPGCENCIASGLPPPPILPFEWMNSVELAPPSPDDPVVAPAASRRRFRALRRLARRLPGLRP